MAETETTTTPSIEGLDPQSETYVSDLDAGLKQLVVLSGELHADQAAYAHSLTDRILEHTSAAGIETEQSMKQETSLPGGTILTTKYAVFAKGKEQNRPILIKITCQ